MDVRLCLGLVKPGPTGPFSSDTGAVVEGLLVRVGVAIGPEGGGGAAGDDGLIPTPSKETAYSRGRRKGEVGEVGEEGGGQEKWE